MNTLHIVSCSPQSEHTLSNLRRLLGNDDGILLTGNGVYIALSPKAEMEAPLFALESDVRARGLLPHWPAAIPLLDHGDYVDLCVRYPKSLNWS